MAQATLPNQATMQPVQTHERIATLDVLRGLALFGILLVNMAFFNASAAHIFVAAPPGTWWDQAATWFTRFFAEGKFYPIFAFLFGLGFAIQLQRAEARGTPIIGTYLRRLLVLFLIGLAHLTLLWYGDILTTYAVLGVALLLFRRCRPRTLLIWAAIFVALPVLMIAGFTALYMLALLVPGSAAAIQEGTALYTADMEQAARTAAQIYAGGTFAEMIEQRLRDVGMTVVGLIYSGPHVFAMLLLGLYAGKRRVFHNIAAHQDLFRKALVWGLAIGLPLNLVFVLNYDAYRSMEPSVWTIAATTALFLGGPALSFAYIGGATLLLQKARWRARSEPIAAVGRMALTNYLLQTLICTTIFYGWGLGLYGQVGAAAGLGLAAAIYVVQIPLSVWWLSRFRYGPMEWVWRVLTYGKLPTMRARGGAIGPPAAQA